MTEVLKICGAALIIAACGFLLREFGWRGAVVFSVLGSAVFIGFLAEGLGRLVSSISPLFEYTYISDIAKEILKLTGISYVFGMSADICSDLGEKTLSNALLVVGRVEIFLIVLPYFLKIIKYATELIG